jgi:short-subunit dehydrogenase
LTVQDWSYRGRWGLVTGASAGIGRVFAEKLAERGMHLVLSARRVERLEELAAVLRRDHGVQTATIAADLLTDGEPAHLWRDASAGRDIDLLVNNAGFGAQGEFHQLPLERHLAVLRLNGAVLLELSYLALAHMRPRQDGAIINVSSIAAFQPVPRLATYAASKAFVLSLSEALWAENQASGVRVLALCPGRTPTEFQEVAGTGSAEGAFGFRTPEQVVDAGLRALERGRSSVVPGVENRAATWAVRALPRSLLVRAMRAVVRRFWTA